MLGLLPPNSKVTLFRLDLEAAPWMIFPTYRIKANINISAVQGIEDE